MQKSPIDNAYLEIQQLSTFALSPYIIEALQSRRLSVLLDDGAVLPRGRARSSHLYPGYFAIRVAHGTVHHVAINLDNNCTFLIWPKRWLR